MMSTIARGDRIRRHVGATTLALTILAVASVALAQGPGGGAERPVRLEGYWSGTKADKDVIGVITVSADGKEKRSFAVTALQAYAPEEEGIDVLRPSSLQPITVLLRGDDTMIRRFMTAAPDDTVIALGVYQPGAGNLILTSVAVGAKTGESSTGS